MNTPATPLAPRRERTRDELLALAAANKAKTLAIIAAQRDAATEYGRLARNV